MPQVEPTSLRALPCNRVYWRHVVDLLAHVRRSVAIVAAVPLVLALVASGRLMSDRNVVFPGRTETRIDIDAALNEVNEFDISEGTLPDQLEQLLNNHHLTYLYSFRELAAVRGHAVRDRIALGTALRAILQNTGCYYETLESSLAVVCALGSDLNRGTGNVKTPLASDPR